jgi:ribosome recycling factor
MPTIDEVTHEAEHKMQVSIETARHEFAAIRTGRANPSMLDGVHVEAYGSNMPINQLAQVHAPEPRQLVVSPYDRAMLAPIEKAIKNSDLNLNPMNDGVSLRINLPVLTEERRKDMVKSLHKKAEESRISVRNVRRDANDKVKAIEKLGEASEDQSRRVQESLQKMTDKYIAQIDSLQKDKETELLTA